MTFDSLRIDTRCLQLLTLKGILEPTPIQAKAIPVALTGRDLTAVAQTGTGKTLAFGLPALTRIAALPRGVTHMVVLAPTRELVQQVHDVLAPLAKAMGLTTACVYGGAGMEPQAQALRRGASIVLACPGRLLDHIGRGNDRFQNVSMLVLDEADRMLDMGFLPDIRRIVARLPQQRQTMMFSATFPPDIARLADTLMKDPIRIETGAVARPADAVRQAVVTVPQDGKLELLKDILSKPEVGTTIVFVRTKRATDRIAKALITARFDAVAIHGGLSQSRRNRAIAGFRTGDHKIMVATDVAARGLDVKGISHVINYDMPSTTDDYVHRIGRTARAEATGDAITFVSPEDHGALRDIERHIGRRLDRTAYTGPLTPRQPRPAPAQGAAPARPGYPAPPVYPAPPAYPAPAYPGASSRNAAPHPAPNHSGPRHAVAPKVLVSAAPSSHGRPRRRRATGAAIK